MLDTQLSKDIHCLHTITQKDGNSILSLVVHESYLFSGSEGSKIYVKINENIITPWMLMSIIQTGLGFEYISACYCIGRSLW